MTACMLHDVGQRRVAACIEGTAEKGLCDTRTGNAGIDSLNVSQGPSDLRVSKSRAKLEGLRKSHLQNWKCCNADPTLSDQQHATSANSTIESQFSGLQSLPETAFEPSCSSSKIAVADPHAGKSKVVSGSQFPPLHKDEHSTGQHIRLKTSGTESWL